MNLAEACEILSICRTDGIQIIKNAYYEKLNACDIDEFVKYTAAYCRLMKSKGDTDPDYDIPFPIGLEDAIYVDVNEIVSMFDKASDNGLQVKTDWKLDMVKEKLFRKIDNLSLQELNNSLNFQKVAYDAIKDITSEYETQSLRISDKYGDWADMYCKKLESFCFSRLWTSFFKNYVSIVVLLISIASVWIFMNHTEYSLLSSILLGVGVYVLGYLLHILHAFHSLHSLKIRPMDLVLRTDDIPSLLKAVSYHSSRNPGLRMVAARAVNRGDVATVLMAGVFEAISELVTSGFRKKALKNDVEKTLIEIKRDFLKIYLDELGTYANNIDTNLKTNYRFRISGYIEFLIGN